MTNERRRQERAQRVRQRRAARPMEPSRIDPNDIEMPGIFGWMQRNGKVLILGGIVVMLISVGSSIFAANTNTSSGGSTATVTATAEGGQPVGTPGPDGVVRRYSGLPPMTIDQNKTYEAVFTTEKGEFRLQLLAKDAPTHVNNFVFLARNKFYDGLTFHRVIADFVAQGGDPLGNGSGGPGYVLPPETNTVPLDAGVVAMASSQAGVSGSQFFITLTPQPRLELLDFKAFGRVTSGMEVVKALTLRDPQQQNQPPPDRILKVDIIEKG